MKPEYPALYRIWHWMTAFSTLGLLGTVLLRKTFLSWRTNSALIQSELSKLGTEISADNAKAIAKAIRAPMWEWHYIFGAILAAAVLLRIFLLVRGVRTLAIVRVFKAADNHQRLKAAVYSGITLALLLMTISGGVMYFHEFLGVSKDTAGDIKEVHENMMYVVLGLTIMHISKVLLHEVTTKESIISRMIHGDDDG